MRMHLLLNASGAVRLPGPVRRELVNLAFNQLRLRSSVSSDEIEAVVRLVDSGALDDATARSASAEDLPVTPEMYDDVKAFSYEAWKKRHNVKS